MRIRNFVGEMMEEDLTPLIFFTVLSITLSVT